MIQAKLPNLTPSPSPSPERRKLSGSPNQSPPKNVRLATKSPVKKRVKPRRPNLNTNSSQPRSFSGSPDHVVSKMQRGHGVSVPYRDTRTNNFANYNSQSLKNRKDKEPGRYTATPKKYQPITARMPGEKRHGTYQPKNNFVSKKKGPKQATEDHNSSWRKSAPTNKIINLGQRIVNSSSTNLQQDELAIGMTRMQYVNGSSSDDQWIGLDNSEWDQDECQIHI